MMTIAKKITNLRRMRKVREEGNVRVWKTERSSADFIVNFFDPTTIKNEFMTNAFNKVYTH